MGLSRSDKMHPLNINSSSGLFKNCLFLYHTNVLITASKCVHTAVYTPACMYKVTCQRPLNFGREMQFLSQDFLFSVWICGLEKQWDSEWRMDRFRVFVSGAPCISLFVLLGEVYWILHPTLFPISFSFDEIFLFFLRWASMSRKGLRINTTILKPPSSTPCP